MNKSFVFIILLFLALNAYSKEHRIEMLNKDAKESMTFKPIFLKANLGDVVVFVPTTKGHTSESVFTPVGANSWAGKTSQEVKVTLNKEGIYIYNCKNHGVMGMTGLIQVGKASNLSQAKEFYEKFKKKMAMNKNRLTKYLEAIDH
jgi:pseudoazurin